MWANLLKGEKMVQKFDWEKGHEVFWGRFEKRAPEIRAIGPFVAERFKEIWGDIVPIVGIEQGPEFSVDKDGKLKCTWMGWLLIDVIVDVAIDLATKVAKADFDKSLAELEKRIDDKLKEYVKFPG